MLFVLVLTPILTFDMTGRKRQFDSTLKEAKRYAIFCPNVEGNGSPEMKNLIPHRIFIVRLCIVTYIYNKHQPRVGQCAIDRYYGVPGYKSTSRVLKCLRSLKPSKSLKNRTDSVDDMDSGSSKHNKRIRYWHIMIYLYLHLVMIFL